MCVCWRHRSSGLFVAMIFEVPFKFEIVHRGSRSLFCLLKPPLSLQKWLTRAPLNNHECIVFRHMYSCIHYSKWREQNQFHAWGCFPCGHVVSHLQCTTMGPASGGLHDFTRLRKARKGVGCSGTPWSGQAVNWNCLTSLFSLEPFWRRTLGCEGEVSVLLWRRLRCDFRRLLTLKRESVLTQYVASSTVSNSVTWMRPYVSVPLVGQYWSHFTWSGDGLQCIKSFSSPFTLSLKKTNVYTLKTKVSNEANGLKAL